MDYGEQKILIDHFLHELEVVVHPSTAERFERIQDEWRTNGRMSETDLQWIKELYENYC